MTLGTCILRAYGPVLKFGGTLDADAFRNSGHLKMNKCKDAEDGTELKSCWSNTLARKGHKRTVE